MIIACVVILSVLIYANAKATRIAACQHRAVLRTTPHQRGAPLCVCQPAVILYNIT